jgi:hypothetical protein
MRIVRLRLAVGLLGERDQAGWWPSGFMSQASKAFLAPVFGERVLLWGETVLPASVLPFKREISPAAIPKPQRMGGIDGQKGG